MNQESTHPVTTEFSQDIDLQNTNSNSKNEQTEIFDDLSEDIQKYIHRKPTLNINNSIFK